MFWAHRVREEVRKRFEKEIAAGRPLVIRDEKTASGRVHIGSLRGVVIHGVVSEVLSEANIKNRYLFEINDYDPMDGLPVYLDENKFRPFMGMPLCAVPAPDGKAKNYAEYFGEEFVGVIRDAGFNPEVYRGSELYKAGKYNDAIRLVLDNAETIRDIYKRVSGAVRDKDWFPLSVICERCGKVGTTRVTSWNGEQVTYECGNIVTWAVGCGHRGTVAPWNGAAKLPWKVEWAAKFYVLDVAIEGGGKDHSTKGGAREIADAISREVFKREPPLNIPYEFFIVGGRKMSSSKGAGSSAREIANLLPAELLRFLMIHKEPERAIDFIPDGDTIPNLYDTYDSYAKNFWSDAPTDFGTMFYFSQLPAKRAKVKPYLLPRFVNVAYLVQMPHLKLTEEIEKLEGTKLTAPGREELESRARYAREWLAKFAPENYKFDIQTTIPAAAAKNLSAKQKKALSDVLAYLVAHPGVDGPTLHTALHEIKKETGITPKEFFGAIYSIVLGKQSGPKAGWFLSVLDRNFLLKRLKESVV